MLLRLSRLSLWFAAAAAGLGLFGPTAGRGLFADVALALGGVSFVLWRAALALRRRLVHAADVVPDALPLDDAALREAESLVARAAAEATTLDAALQRVGELLRGELGARAVRAFVVDERDGAAGLSELITARPIALRAPRRVVELDDSPIGRALRERRASIDLPRSVVLPVLHEGRAIGLLELLGIEMTIDAAALAQLLASTATALASVADRVAPPPVARQSQGTLREVSALPARSVPGSAGAAAC